MARLVRQPRRSGQVADCIDAGFGGTTLCVYDYMPRFDRHPGPFQAQPFGIANNADRHQHIRNLQLLLLAVSLQRYRQAVAGCFDTCDQGSGADIDPLLHKRAAHEGGNFRVFDR